MKNAGRSVIALLSTLFALVLGGCFVVRERVLLDEALPVEHIREIRRGITTKREILERLGPPAAVARRGTTMVFPRGPALHGRADVPSAVFLELFSPARALQDTDIVYYYDASRRNGTGVLVVPLIGGGYFSTETVVERLWVLIDEGTGTVEDYVFRGGD